MNFIKRHYIFLFCILGSIVRLIYGIMHQPWLQSPDQMAWEIILDQKMFTYDHLIHYPHEGGTIVISLISQVINILTSLNSLSITAFILDFLIRIFQMNIIEKVFNSKIAFYFGLWTIFATSTIIPWGTTIFGLHYISGIFPFVFLFLISKREVSFKNQILNGTIIALMIWFNYTNLMLAPIFIIHLLTQTNRLQNAIAFLSSLLVIILLHFIIRLNFSAGFILNEYSLFSVRGESLSTDFKTFINRLLIIPDTLSNALIALPINGKARVYFKIVIYLFFGFSLTGIILSIRNKSFNKNVLYIIILITLFSVIYLLSPFYFPENFGNYIAFRHLSFIVPLISLLIIISLSFFRIKVLVYIFIVICSMRSINLFSLKNSVDSNDLALKTGWILGSKFGHDPNKIIKLVSSQNNNSILLQGAVWGINSSLLFDTKQISPADAELKVQKLVSILTAFPKGNNTDIKKGLLISFSNKVSPVLDPALLPLIEKRLNKN